MTTRRASVGLLIAGLLVAVAVAVAGWRLGLDPAPAKRREPAPAGLAVGPVRVVVPASWRRVDASVPGIRGLDRTRTAVFELAPGLRAYGLLSFGEPVEPSLVSRTLRAQLSRPLPGPQTAELAGRSAWSYADMLTRRVDGRIDISVLPTSAGTLTVVCTADEAYWAAASGCASTLGRISARRATFVAPAPDLVFRRQLPAVLDRLEGARAAGRSSLRAARTRGGQALIARRVARAYASAVARLSPLAPPNGLARDVVILLYRAGRDYERSAEAAEIGAELRYAAARAALRVNERRLAARVAALLRPAGAS